MTKSELRKNLILKRKSLSEKEKALLDLKVTDNFLNSDLYLDSKGFLIYVSTDIEVDTRKIIEKAFSDGKAVAVPKCSKTDNKMDFYFIKSFNDLKKGCFGIDEPSEECKRINDFNNHLCVVPGLAFDKNGYRLGFGKGFYDRFLSENNVTSVGLCYKSFLLNNLPVEGFDKSVDFIITD